MPALTVAKASVEQVRDNPAAVPHVPQDASVPALTARTGWMLHWLYPGQPLTPARAYHYALMASLGTDGYVVILPFVPGLGLLLGMPAASAASPPGGLQLAGADADGP